MRKFGRFLKLYLDLGCKMQCKFLSPSFLTCIAIFATSQESGAAVEEVCDEQLLLFRKGYGLEKFCPTTNESFPLTFLGPKYRPRWQAKIAYSPRDGGKIAVASDTKFMMFVKKESGNQTFLQSINTTLPSEMDPHSPSNVDTPYDMAINWMTETAYLTYGSLRIVAYDLNTFKYAKIFEGEYHPKELGFIGPIVTHPARGLLIWIQDDSIRRSFLDGTEVKTLMEVKYASGLAVDPKTSLVYWNVWNGDYFKCDMDGNNCRVVNLAPKGGLENLSVLRNVMYYQEKIYDPVHFWNYTTALYRADVEKGTKQLVYNDSDALYLQILPDARDFESSNVNPCANNSCSHMCVQSSQKKHACLCPDGYMLHREGGDCTIAQLILVSTNKGIFQIPHHAHNSSRKAELVNATEPSHLQCDNERGLLYWVEQDVESTRIMSAEIGHFDKGHECVLKWDRVSIRYPAEELQAFALDWITSNIYVVFRDQRRILACSGNKSDSVTMTTAKSNRCAEFFGNQVASSVGGLALDPSRGEMYWTHQDDGDLAIVSGGMDGTELKILKERGLKRPTSIAIHYHSVRKQFHIYWVDSYFNHIECIDLNNSSEHGIMVIREYKDYVPQRIAVDKRNIYWVGLSANGSSGVIYNKAPGPNLGGVGGFVFLHSENFVAGDFSQVSGLSIYDAKWHAEKRRNTMCAKGHPCASICVLSGEGSYRCACPIGSEPYGLNGSSCRELELPVVLYRGANWTVVVKNGSSRVTVPSFPASAKPVTYDPARSKIIWLRGMTRDEYCRRWYCRFSIYGQFLFGKESARMIVHDPQAHFTTGMSWVTPFSCEYDWAGENIYATLEDTGFVIIGRNGEFAPVFDRFNRTRVVSKIRKVALDPSAGWMYWIYKDNDFPQNTGIWRAGMDGSHVKLFTQRSNAKAGLDLAFDHSSKFIFWVEEIFVASNWDQFWEIHRSHVDGGNVQKIVTLREKPVRIHIVGNRLFWTSSSGKQVTSCHKETANNLMIHDLHNVSENGGDFSMISSTPLSVQSGMHPCSPAKLCSHICAVTPTGYMRCLCPEGYKLLSDGWTCECADFRDCIKNERDSTRRPSVDPTGQVDYGGGVCPGNYYPCAGICLEVSHVCNGIANCPDYSDEGERCNEACGSNQNCSFTCISSPKGPVCLCSPGQMLDEDKRSCILLRAEGGTTWKIVAGVVGLILVVVITLGTFMYRQTQRKLRNLTVQEIEEFLRGDPAGASTAPDGLDRALLLPYAHIISLEDITRNTEKVLGSGEFGVVYPGTYKSEPVAIKTFKRSVEVDEFKAVLAELKIMAYLGDHEFIVKFVGAEISEIAKRKLMIVNELSPHGDLLHCLWKVASESTPNGSRLYENFDVENHAGVTTHTLYKWCEQIATGMEYLAQKQIVHGDLATRNVLLFNDRKVAKISDFGLSKQLYGSSTYQTKRQCKLPWAWAAIELLTSMEFSEGSDVWAFGVTVWEIFSLGQAPYKGTTYSQEFLECLKAGSRLMKPQLATDEIYKVLLECWNIERSNRPKFYQLRQVFGEMSAGEMSGTVGSAGQYANLA